MTAFANADMAAIGALLQDYFDGLYDGDVAKFERVFHP
ncbi:MAG: nuclear transport factor 2 family protein, partial [Pseudomonadota bacterium]|nr:nuclear transport factor 2 family protein [Pseudomonadota bacterium]